MVKVGFFLLYAFAASLQAMENFEVADQSVKAEFTTKISPLIFAAKVGDINLIEATLKNDSLVDEQDGEGNTALLHAAYNGNSEAARLLLKKGANGLHKNKANLTSLKVATICEHANVIRALLESGVEVNDTQSDAVLVHVGEGLLAYDYQSLTAFQIAVIFGCIDIVLLFLEKGAKYYTALNTALKARQDKIMSLLINYAQTNAEKEGFTVIETIPSFKQGDRPFSVNQKIRDITKVSPVSIPTIEVKTLELES